MYEQKKRIVAIVFWFRIRKIMAHDNVANAIDLLFS